MQELKIGEKIYIEPTSGRTYIDPITAEITASIYYGSYPVYRLRELRRNAVDGHYVSGRGSQSRHLLGQGRKSWKLWLHQTGEDSQYLFFLLNNHRDEGKNNNGRTAAFSKRTIVVTKICGDVDDIELGEEFEIILGKHTSKASYKKHCPYFCLLKKNRDVAHYRGSLVSIKEPQFVDRLKIGREFFENYVAGLK